MKTALIVAPHPDDAELAMGGTIIKLIATGCNVIIVDLTDGEPTPFGSKILRTKETQKATKILGLKTRLCLGMPNRCLEPTLQNRKKLAEVIRIYRPDMLFGPVMPDWHPDHKATFELLESARFEAKYHKTDLPGQPHWTPKVWLYYSPHRNDFINPSIIIDISDVWHKKLDAIKAYKSQLKNRSISDSYSLIERIEITARYFGQNINAKFGEPLKSCQPVSINSIGFL